MISPMRRNDPIGGTVGYLDMDTMQSEREREKERREREREGGREGEREANGCHIEPLSQVRVVPNHPLPDTEPSHG